MALWYSSRAKTEGAGVSLSRPKLGIKLVSLLKGTSFRLVAAGKPALGRTGRRGLTGQSDSPLSEQLLSF